MPGPFYQWMALQSGERVVEVLNASRTSAYLQNTTLAPEGYTICDVMDDAGCAQFNYLPCSDRGYITFPGTTGNYLSAPDAAALDIVGDITLIARIAPTDWSPAAIQTIVSKWNTTGNQRSYGLELTTAGALSFRWSNNGTADNVLTSAVNLAGLSANSSLWVRVDFDVDNGAAGRTARFYTSYDGLSWGLFDTQTSATATTIFAGTATLNIGAISAGTAQPFNGAISYVQVRNGASHAPTVGGSAVFTYDGPTNLLLATSATTTFLATTGQTVTVNRSGGSQTAVIAVYMAYATPATDPAPWYSASYPQSAEALGFYIEEWTGLGDGHVRGNLASIGGPGGGGRVGSLYSDGRVMKLNVLMIARNDEAMVYLFDWLSATLIGVCGGCGDDKMLLRRWCGPVSDPLEGLGEMRRVKLVEGLSWESEPMKVASCVMRRASFTLAAGDPCVYSSEVTPAVDGANIAANLDTCFTATYNSATRYPCRPQCSEMPNSCRSAFRFTVDPLAAVAPVVYMANTVAEATFPMRALLYADPNLIGVTTNPCGLPLIAEVYVRSLPGYSEFVWDVAGRMTWFRDVSTGEFIEGWPYIDVNDPGIQRYSAVPCGVAWIVLEPGTLCITLSGGDATDVNTGQVYLNPHFPTVTLRTQERYGCA